MIKKPFIGFLKPQIEYVPIGPATPPLLEMAMPKRVMLLADIPLDSKTGIMVKKGDTVRTGQKLTLFKNEEAYVISTVTGTIADISAYFGDRGRKYTSLTIEADGKQERDAEFGKSPQPSLESAKRFLQCLPGKPRLGLLGNPDKPVNTIVVTGTDADLMVSSNQYAVRYHSDKVKKGMEILKKISGVNTIVLTIPPSLSQEVQDKKFEAKTVDTWYPSAFPHLIARNILKQEVPAGKSAEDLGILFIHAESVASIAAAYDTGVIPVRKTVTVIQKNGAQQVVSAVIGASIGSILGALDITVNENDRVVAGGPMTGSPVYSLDYPVQPDTNAIMVQDKDDIAFISDSACINCGECIRICPAKVPVNMLVRLLEAGQYGDAADNYDLYSCIECGLCSYVCTARIPIFQYITLAKYEHALSLAPEAEAENA